MIKKGSLVRVKDYENIKDHFDFAEGMEQMCGNYLIVKREEPRHNGESCFSIKHTTPLDWYENYWFYESMLDEVDLNALSRYIMRNIDKLREEILDN